jgi:hypothetical protein
LNEEQMRGVNIAKPNQMRGQTNKRIRYQIENGGGGGPLTATLKIGILSSPGVCDLLQLSEPELEPGRVSNLTVEVCGPHAGSLGLLHPGFLTRQLMSDSLTGTVVEHWKYKKSGNTRNLNPRKPIVRPLCSKIVRPVNNTFRVVCGGALHVNCELSRAGRELDTVLCSAVQSSRESLRIKVQRVTRE